MKQNLTILAICILFHWSCEEKTDWTFNETAPYILVVDGMLTDQLKNHKVWLRFPVNALNEIPEPATGAIVHIAYKDGTDTIFHQLPENLSIPGQYETGVIKGEPGRIYFLIIEYEGYQFFAMDYMRQAIPFVPTGVKHSEDSPGLFELNFFYNNFASSDPAIWIFHIDWSHMPDTVLSPGGNKKAKLVYYSLPSIDVNGLLLPGYEKVAFPLGTIIIQEKYAISEIYAEYLRTMLAETDWRGGIFDTFPGNVYTNINENASGFFSTCSVWADTIVVLP
ncbi:MAG: DUF4249 domain-containing protein [Bacteroidales bacterium]|nr:DUF4249 domain-containing protein [Bacteroidales bacterium]